jgi:hypothetical protein
VTFLFFLQNNSSKMATATSSTNNPPKSRHSIEDKSNFFQAISMFANGEKPVEFVLNCLGQHRRGDTASLARDELKKILEKREEIEDILGLEAGTLWTLEEEKLFEYGLYLNDGSSQDRFGLISSLMCGTRSREECKRRYMKLVLDICQIEMGSKSLNVVYFAPYPAAQIPQPGMPPSQGPWMS